MQKKNFKKCKKRKKRKNAKNVNFRGEKNNTNTRVWTALEYLFFHSY